jgi:hypothetical protein
MFGNNSARLFSAANQICSWKYFQPGKIWKCAAEIVCAVCNKSKFVQRFRNKIKGVSSGFDRIIFKGCLRPIAYADGAMAASNPAISRLRFSSVKSYLNIAPKAQKND